MSKKKKIPEHLFSLTSRYKNQPCIFMINKPVLVRKIKPNIALLKIYTYILHRKQQGNLNIRTRKCHVVLV